MEDIMDYEEAYKQLMDKYQKLEQAFLGYDQAVKTAYEDPELRPHLKKIAEKVGVKIDDPPHEKRYQEELEKLNKKIEEIETKKKEEEGAKKKVALQELLGKYGITDAEYSELEKFIKETGIFPSTLEGWETVLQNYRRAKIAQPTYQKPDFKGRIGSEFWKNPEEALFGAHLQALGVKR